MIFLFLAYLAHRSMFDSIYIALNILFILFLYCSSWYFQHDLFFHWDTSIIDSHLYHSFISILHSIDTSFSMLDLYLSDRFHCYRYFLLIYHTYCDTPLFNLSLIALFYCFTPLIFPSLLLMCISHRSISHWSTIYRQISIFWFNSFMYLPLTLIYIFYWSSLSLLHDSHWSNSFWGISLIHPTLSIHLTHWSTIHSDVPITDLPISFVDLFLLVYFSREFKSIILFDLPLSPLYDSYYGPTSMILLIVSHCSTTFTATPFLIYRYLSHWLRLFVIKR